MKNILIIFAAVVVFGIILGFYYSSLPEHHPRDNKEACESVGGDWASDRCLVSYKEAGEECIDGGQCESGVCYPQELTEEQIIEIMNGPISNMTGTCYPDSMIDGCIKQVLGGTISKQSLCLDE
ncbi:hypothetical protein K8R62_03905 [bacterium]|nr:hypothetical protein [bacterium]